MDIQNFYDILTGEVVNNGLGLSPEKHKKLKAYYRKLASNPKRAAFYRYNWISRVAPIHDIIVSYPKRGKSVSILDAGCGVGTETLFWSLLREDIDITGVDISPDRLQVAEARRLAYESRYERSLAIRFREENVFNILRREHFDIVWVMEAISHIDPAEEFIESVFSSLRHGGYLVVSDSHLSNPAMAWRVFKLRRRGKSRRSTRTISSGETVSYANERLFSATHLAKIMRKAGLKVVQEQLRVFFPPIFSQYPSLFDTCTALEPALNKIPIVRKLGAIYTIVACKPPTSVPTNS